MHKDTVWILLASSILAAGGQVLLKFGSQGQVRVVDLVNLANFGGVSCYVLGALFWMIALSKAPLYFVYPFTILTFVFVGGASIILFGERPSIIVFIGWAVVLCGVVLIAVGLSE